MKLYLRLVFVFSLLSPMANAQLASGDIAPDFTLFDLDGNSHHLYGYLTQGKTVYLEFYACHCPGCWAYHNTGTLDSLYTAYGPGGTDQIMVLMLEHDLNTTMDHFLGNHWYTQGNWLEGNPVPIIDVADADRGVFTDYGIVSYPRVLKICSDKTVEWVYTWMTPSQLYQEADECPGPLAIETVSPLAEMIVTIVNQQLVITNASNDLSVSMMNSMGQEVQIESIEGTDNYTISELETGLYFVRVSNDTETVVKKIQVQ